MSVDRLLFLEAFAEILALQHLLQGDATVETNDFLVAHLAKPIAVENNLGAAGIENLEGLLAIGLGVGLDFFVGQVRPGGGTAAGIADHPRKITDDENGLMPEILEFAQLAQDDGVAEVNIGAGRIDSEFHAQRPAEGQLFPQLVLADNLGGAVPEKGERFIRLHDPGRNTEPAREALFVLV